MPISLPCLACAPPAMHLQQVLLHCAVLCCAVIRFLHRYKKAADWELLSGLVQDNPTLPIIGNGDILTHYEAADRCGVPLYLPSQLSLVCQPRMTIQNLPQPWGWRRLGKQPCSPVSRVPVVSHGRSCIHGHARLHCMQVAEGRLHVADGGARGAHQAMAVPGDQGGVSLLAVC